MNYGRIIQKTGFTAGLGYGMGLTVGLVSGVVLVGACAAAAFGGYIAVKKHLKNKKKEMEAE